MRSLIYWAIVAYLFYAGITNMISVSETGTPLEVPFVGEMSGDSWLSLPSFGEAKIAPNSEWGDILVGTWKFKIMMQSKVGKGVFTGSINYSPDGSFVRRIKYNAYRKKIIDENSYTAGGKVTGMWAVNSDSTWTEIVKDDDCNIEVSYGGSDFSVCDEFYRDTVSYGVKESNVADYELLEFNNSKIQIRVKDLRDGLNDTYLFTRVGSPPERAKEERKPLDGEKTD